MFTDANKTEYKSTYQFLKDISEIYNDLTDKNQAELLETIGGKRGAQSLAGILADFSEVERAMTNMTNAAGSADQEMGIIEDSLEFKINALKQTWVGTLQELTDRGTFGEIIDFVTTLSEGIGSLVTDFGLLQTAIVGFGTYIGTKHLKMFGDDSVFGSLSGDGLLSKSKKDFKDFKEYKSTIKSLTEELDVLQQVKSDIDNNLVNSDQLKGYISGLEGISDGSKNVIENTESLDAQINTVGNTLEETKNKGTKFGNALKGIGFNLLNAFASVAISTAISLTITGISKLMSSYEDLAKETQEVADKYNDQKTQLLDYSSEIKELQEVMHDSSSTTEEVKDATARLYEIQNDLIGTYPAYSEGINLVNGELENQLALLKEIDKQNANKALNEINGKKSNKVKAINLATIAGSYHGTGILGGVLADLGVKTAKGMITKNQSFKEARSHAWDTGAYGIDFGTKAVGSSTDQIRKQYEKFNYTLKTTDKTVQELAKSYGDIFTVDTEKNTITATGNIRDVNKAVQQFQTQLEAAGVTNEDVFNELTNIYNETNDRITQYADSYDTETQKQILNNKVLSDSYYQLVDAHDAIIKAQESGDVDEVERLREEYKKLFSSIADNGKVTDRYLDYFKNLYPELQDLISSWEFEVDIKPSLEKNRFGVNDLLKNNTLDELRTGWYEFNANRDNKNYSEHTKNQYREIERLAADAGYTSAIAFIESMKSTMEYADTGSEAFLQRIDNNTDGVPSEVVEARNKIAKSWYDGLEESQREFVDSLSKEDLAEVVQFSSTKQFDEWLAKCEEKAKLEVKTEFKESDAVDSMADAKTAVTSLEELWNQTVQNSLSLGKDKKYLDENGNVIKQLNDKNQAVGFADPATINNVESAFYKFSEKLEAEGNDAAANKINAALENFEKTLVEFPGDADKAQGAIDDLITAYIDQTDIIKNLTEENAEWSKAQLEAMGITNAEQVVQSRLNSNYKYNIAALRELTNEVENYNNAMANTKDVGAQNKALESLTAGVNKAIANYDSEGNVLAGSYEVNDQFVKQHLADVQAMADGDEEALNRVRMAAARGAAMEVSVNVPTDVAEMQINNLMDMIVQADAMNIEPGASIDDASFYDHLNQMLRNGEITVDQVNAAFSALGFEAKWKSNRTIVRVPTGNHVTSIPSDVPGIGGTAIHWDWAEQTYDFPSLEVVTKKGGSKASYHPSSGGSTGTGGGGGGGNGGGSGSDSNKDESEETFDWVEVAIQRVEDQINHLDEAVENVYSMWGERNKNLRDEIAKTEKELELQATAEDIYLAKAEDVGLDKAYRTKVEQGEAIDINSIETVNKEELINKINEYKQWWEKYKQAQYAQQTLEIKLGEQYKKRFDQFKEEYEEQINLVQSYADLIDKRLNRVEEKGYFASKEYYKELQNLESQNIKTQKAELDKLIKARDEAVASGRIEYGSQAWHEMTQEILGVASAIEESTTNLIKWDKQMRQIDWDVFDFMEERIDQVNQEADFLIDLLDNQKMYKDTGNFNQRGWGAVEMRAVKYDTYMQQSRDYAKERAKIEKELAKDPADKELIKYREELIKLQQESIKNAYAEKEAVKDLVQEGRYLLSINLFNCWETLKTIIPQRKDEICLGVMV